MKPSTREAPLGTWVSGKRGMLVCDEARLLAMPKDVMGLDYLSHHRALTTAFRLLEGFGVLRLGDCIIQNGAESAVGVAVIQLCRMLRLSCINVVDDTPKFADVAKACAHAHRIANCAAFFEKRRVQGFQTG